MSSDMDGLGETGDEVSVNPDPDHVATTITYKDDPSIGHPLLMYPVLRELFRKLPVSDLCSCRLVSRYWLDSALVDWRTNLCVCLKSTSIAKFLEFWEKNCLTLPFRKFKLYKWSYDPVAIIHSRFFLLSGKTMTSLTLSHVRFAKKEDCQLLIYQLLPSLVSLTMQRCEFSDGYDDGEEDENMEEEDDDEDAGSVDEIMNEENEDDEDVDSGDEVMDEENEDDEDADSVNGNMDEENEKDPLPLYKEPAFGVHGLKSLYLDGQRPDTLMGLLGHFHSLESLFLIRMHEHKESRYELFNVIRSIRNEDNNKLPLTECLDAGSVLLDLCVTRIAYRLKQIAVFEKLRLPLNDMIITLQDDCKTASESENMNIVRRVLQNHHTKLKKLYCSGKLNGACSAFPFGLRLERLAYMQIEPIFCDNLNWLQFTPVLSILIVPYTNEFDVLFSNTHVMDNMRLPCMKKLVFFFDVGAENMQKLVRWMPNVEEIHVRLDDEQFAIICEHWTKLVAVIDCGSQLTDDGLIGNELGNGINQLKGLERFTSFSRALTSRAIHDGLLKLPSLKKIYFPHATFQDSVKPALERAGIIADIRI